MNDSWRDREMIEKGDRKSSRFYYDYYASKCIVFKAFIRSVVNFESIGDFRGASH